MTYCVGLKLDAGLVFMSDTRTNAGVDDISTVRKMKSWTIPGERHITMLSAGNLATTQTVISRLEERNLAKAERNPSFLSTPSMFQVAQTVGDTLREVISGGTGGGMAAGSMFSASMIVGGQIAGSEPTIFMIYPEGNFVETSSDTPFFQIGEVKYGRPILLRGYSPDMSFDEAIKLLLLSYDSTIRSNLAVDLPIDVQVMHNDSFRAEHQFRIEADDDYFRMLSQKWSDELRDAVSALPAFDLSARS